MMDEVGLDGEEEEIELATMSRQLGLACVLGLAGFGVGLLAG